MKGNTKHMIQMKQIDWTSGRVPAMAVDSGCRIAATIQELEEAMKGGLSDGTIAYCKEDSSMYVLTEKADGTKAFEKISNWVDNEDLSKSFVSPFAVADEDGNNIKATYLRKDEAGNLAPAGGGNSKQADKLAAARSITLMGDVTGTVKFDGSQDVSIEAKVDAGRARLVRQDTLEASYAKKTGEGATGTWGISVSGSAASVANDATGLSFHGTEPVEKQPVWMWGGADANSAYVYKPENLSVKHAETAGTADKAKTADKASIADTATSATTADTAKSADTAKTADSATKAATADSVDWTGVKNAPAFLMEVNWADVKGAPDVSSGSKIEKVDVTLKAADWKDGQYTIEEPAIKGDSVVIIGLPTGTDIGVYKAYAEACLSEVSQTEGKLVLQALQTVPASDINMKMVIL